jgi:sugar phosphate isomerase/epimerase
VLPGDGSIEFGPILEALRWDGLFDLEIFSDAELEGSLWHDEPRELAVRGVERMREVLSTASA